MDVSTATLTVTEAADQRRSIRKYKDTPIPEEHLREILRVAGKAPSPWNVQPWRVVVVRDPGVKTQLMEASYGQPQVGDARAVFVLYNDMPDALDHAEEFVHPGYGEKIPEEAAKIASILRGYGESEMTQWGHGQVYTFLGFLLLAIQAHGYASSAMLGFEPDKVKALLNLPEHVTLPAIVAVGVADEDGFPHHRHQLDRFVTWS